MRDRLKTTPSAEHAGFMTAVDPSSARRQLQMSTGVVVVLAIAIAVSVFAFRPGDEAVKPNDRHAADLAALRMPTLPHPPMLVTRGG